MALIEVRELSKVFNQPIKGPGLIGAIKHLFTQDYREKRAVDNINFSINEGEAVAYVGPNGAGKSTTIKMLSGILTPTSGGISVNGLDPHKDRIQNARQIGAVFGQRTQLWQDIPVTESLSLIKDIYDIPVDIFKQRLDKLIELLGMSDFLQLTARKLSLGQRMRADLAAALLHEPRIVYLDEPTIGLDIAVKQQVRNFVKQINKEKEATIILTTHDLGDIEELCTRLIMIDKGKIIFDGPLDSVVEKYSTERVLHFQVKESIVSTLSSIIHLPPSCRFEEKSSTHFSISFDKSKISASEIVTSILAVTDIIDFKLDEPKIESVIKRVYEGEIIFS
ncbi:ABC transporter ATP-binding protein [Paenibacillus glucanolyticus]|uniref:ABC transporter ATP-binding protein n=1 Tax=Paenibacillus glucanolyticus TaxID=59843 RepID=UPI00096FAA6B|nr:ATP-binding cassette domain-containing protein [Paenibacillus glucanolyticus]OMF81589.1 sugar ABC transporter ATP-binding protein [Paenibacillus glucanolyticus]